MIETAIILSLQITAIWVVLNDKNPLSWIRAWLATGLDKLFGMTASRYIQKPLWDCLTCMGWIWTWILTWSFNWRLMLAVCGMNYITSKLIDHAEGSGRERVEDVS